MERVRNAAVLAVPLIPDRYKELLQVFREARSLPDMNWSRLK